MVTFGLRLRERAKLLGISNAEAARRAGLAERRYANYTAGEREPDLATLVRIARALGTTPNHLLDFAADEHDDVRARLMHRILSAAPLLSDEALALVAVQIEALAVQSQPGASRPVTD